MMYAHWIDEGEETHFKGAVGILHNALLHPDMRSAPASKNESIIQKIVVNIYWKCGNLVKKAGYLVVPTV